jgi:hypothetical protein
MKISLNTGKFYKAKDSNLGEIAFFYSFSRHVSVHSPLTKKQLKEMVGDFEDRFNEYIKKAITKTFKHDHFEVVEAKSEFQFREDKRKWGWLTFFPRRYDGCQIYVNAIVVLRTKQDLNFMKIKHGRMLNKIEESTEYTSVLLFDHSHLKMLFSDFKDKDFFIREFCYIR